jgi:sec-independent protein translocase protein TatC
MGNDKQELTFLQHLEELRWVLIRSIVAIIIGAVAAFLLKNIIFDYVLLSPRNPDFISNKLINQFGEWFHLTKIGHWLNMDNFSINQHPMPLQNITMGGQFNMHVWVSLVAGFIIAFPYVIYQFWSFISPAFRETEKKNANGAVFFSSFLFLLGVAFGYFILLPFSIDFLTTYAVSDQIENKINFVSYISNITTVTLACGLVFELPIVVYFLTRIGVLTPTFMKKYWRHSVIIILIISAIITPPDVVSQTLVALPLFLLYWISILISAAVVRKQQKKV